jgi:ribosome maturation factor RimP
MNVVSSSLWDRVREVALSQGVELFDLDVPTDTRRSGVMRVYITKPAVSQAAATAVSPAAATAVSQTAADGEGNADSSEGGKGGITFEDCVRVSKRLLDLDEQEELIPAHCTLEVSSPGINRSLRLPDHFVGAIGERVRVKFRSEDTGATRVVHGYIREASGEQIALEGEAKNERIEIPLREIKEARVDFKF